MESASRLSKVDGGSDCHAGRVQVYDRLCDLLLSSHLVVLVHGWPDFLILLTRDPAFVVPSGASSCVRCCLFFFSFFFLFFLPLLFFFSLPLFFSIFFLFFLFFFSLFFSSTL